MPNFDWTGFWFIITLAIWFVSYRSLYLAIARAAKRFKRWWKEDD